MTPRQVIRDVRHLIADDGSPQELSDAVLLTFLNQAINRVATRRPDLFSKYAEMPADEARNIQRLPADGHRLMDVVGYTPSGGEFLLAKKIEFEALQIQLSSTASKPRSGNTALSWARYPKFPRQFLVMPLPLGGDTPVSYTHLTLPTILLV